MTTHSDPGEPTLRNGISSGSDTSREALLALWAEWSREADLHPRYQFAWNNLTAAAVVAGYSPADLSQGGSSSAFDALASFNDWAPATSALYSKVARYTGIHVGVHRTPEPDTGSAPIAHLLNPTPGPRGIAIQPIRATIMCHLLADLDWSLAEILSLTEARTAWKPTSATTTVTDVSGGATTLRNSTLRDLVSQWVEMRPASSKRARG